MWISVRCADADRCQVGAAPVISGNFLLDDVTHQYSSGGEGNALTKRPRNMTNVGKGAYIQCAAQAHVIIYITHAGVVIVW